MKINLLKIYFLIVFLFAVNYISYTSFIQLLILIIIIFMSAKGWNFFKIVLLTSKRDLNGLLGFIRTKIFLYKLQRNDLSVPKVFQQNVKKHPNRVAIKYEDREWTFSQLNDYSNRVSNVMQEYGFQPGEEIALMMNNKSEFIGIWLGLCKSGLVTALINTNQRLNTLIHSIAIVNCKAIIFESEFASAIRDVADDINKTNNLTYFCSGKFDPTMIPAKPIDQLIEESSSNEPKTIKNTSINDRLFYIYTSGTTGLPKAAIIKHHRYIWMGAAFRNLINFPKNKKQNNLQNLECENIYCCLPLYHLAAGCLGTCQSIIFGDTLSIAKKFSASTFWTDCIKYKCTSAQYIGEICRYLLSQPVRDIDKKHNVTLMFGNGLRPKIWREFVNRFNIKQIGEFYGSTEGNTNIINNDNTEGSCGFMSLIIPSIYPVCLIKVDSEGNPIRNEKGLCIRCEGNDSGEFVGKITQDPSRSFDGYANPEANKKKIIRDVFNKGDKAFLSGDLLRVDELGYLYFLDRTGDTYRWKGENISTTEVESIISGTLKQTDCVVFGTGIKDYEGKAGMAVICNKHGEIDLDYLLERLQQLLSKYAIPIFIRISGEVELTGTFKMPKMKFQKQGFDFYNIKDPLYYLDSTKNKYIRIEEGIYQDIINGNIKF